MFALKQYLFHGIVVKLEPHNCTEIIIQNCSCANITVILNRFGLQEIVILTYQKILRITFVWGLGLLF